MRVYLDIAKKLEKEVRNRLMPGDYLPPESQLASRFDVNRHTVRRAIDELVFNGLIERQQGRGNMVVHQPYSYPLHAKAHFTENMAEQGSYPSSEVLSRKLVAVNEKIAAVFSIPMESEVIMLTTLRKINGVPTSLIVHYLADVSWWPVVKHFQCGSLHGYLSDHLGIQLDRQTTRLRARMPTKNECRTLQMNGRTPMMIFRTTNVISGTDKVVEYSTSHTRSDMMEAVLEH